MADSGNFNAPPPGRYDPTPPRPAPGQMNTQEGDRLEQARKVQSLLSSLGGAVGAAPPAAGGASGYGADPRRVSYDYPTPATASMPPPSSGGGIPPEVLSLLNANNAGAGVMTGHAQGSGPMDAYRPPSAQGNPGARGPGYGAGNDPRLSPATRPNYAPSNVSLSPSRSIAPAGGVAGLPPRPADAQAPAEPPLQGQPSTDVGSLLAMLVCCPSSDD